MMYAFLSGKREQDRYVKMFGSSCGARIVHTRHFVSKVQRQGSDSGKLIKRNLPSNIKGIIFSGMLRGNAHLFEFAKSRNIDFYYIDHAYFNQGYKDPYWMRITKNGFVQNTILKNTDPKRFENNFDLKIKDYNFKDKRNIIILPPSNVVSKIFEKQTWEENIIKVLRKHTDRPIIVRQKPNNTSIDDLLYSPIKLKDKIEHKQTLNEVLEDAYCVVAYNSNAAIEALQAGVPVICDKMCPAFPLSHALNEIENLVEKDRMPLFQSLAHGQYTMQEARDEKVFRYLNANKQWR